MQVFEGGGSIGLACQGSRIAFLDSQRVLAFLYALNNAECGRVEARKVLGVLLIKATAFKAAKMKLGLWLRQTNKIVIWWV